MRHLEPVRVWGHFADLCALPRPSKQEGRVHAHIESWARDLGLSCTTDGIGNLILRKPASPGREGHPAITLQSHLDMVCQADQGHPHDFSHDPITPSLQDGWVVAEHTTLGADNGIGVALAMAALEADDIAHPEIEVLFTIDEEAGMGGAHGLASGELRGLRMLNLDSEEWGEVFIGCAGGADVNAEAVLPVEPAPANHLFRRIEIAGLRGGHSGIDIHLGRGNANKLLARLLRRLSKRFGVRLASFSGGTARNAIPRSASAVVALSADIITQTEAFAAAYLEEIRDELSGIDEKVSLAVAPAEPAPVVDRPGQDRLLVALDAAPCGVARMSAACPGVVETSNNLGVIALADGRFSANLMVRSLKDAGTVALAEQIAGLFELAGCTVSIDGRYPGWAPNPDSPLLAFWQDVFAKDFGAPAKVQVIHAGLECGIIASKYPGLDAVSFGPTIKGAHAPGERVEVASVERCWRLLKALLAQA